jgi:integrase
LALATLPVTVFSGPNPAADLRFFIGRQPRRPPKAAPQFFTTEEAPQLIATLKAAYPRWYAFVLTGLLGGLRWGESTALQLGDIDWKRGRLHVQRSFSDKTNCIEAPKSGKARWVQASPELLAALRSHIEAMTLEGQVKRWTPEQRQLVFPNTQGRVTRAIRGLRLAPAAHQGRAHPPRLPCHSALVRYLAPGGRDGPPLGARTTRAREHRPDG